VSRWMRAALKKPMPQEDSHLRPLGPAPSSTEVIFE